MCLGPSRHGTSGFQLSLDPFQFGWFGLRVRNEQVERLHTARHAFPDPPEVGATPSALEKLPVPSRLREFRNGNPGRYLPHEAAEHAAK